MAAPPTRRFGVALVVLGGLTVVAACVPGAIAVGLAWKGDGSYTDATPAELAESDEIHSGEVVWLRGMRDRDHPVTLADGRVLYPAEDDPRVMVECGADACAGSLVGRVEELTVSEPLPPEWPAGADRHVRIVRVGEHGADAREGALIAALAATALLALAIGCGVAGALLVARGRRTS